MVILLVLEWKKNSFNVRNVRNVGNVRNVENVGRDRQTHRQTDINSVIHFWDHKLQLI